MQVNFPDFKNNLHKGPRECLCKFCFKCFYTSNIFIFRKKKYKGTRLGP